MIAGERKPPNTPVQLRGLWPRGDGKVTPRYAAHRVVHHDALNPVGCNAVFGSYRRAPLLLLRFGLEAGTDTTPRSWTRVHESVKR